MSPERQSVGVSNEDVPRMIGSHHNKTRALLTERLRRAQADGDLATTTDPAGLARYLIMVFNGLAL